MRAHLLELHETVVVDGVFLHHPDLRDLWQLTVFLSVDRDLALERGIARDASWMENARKRYATRYVPGEARYLEEVGPESLADIVIDTTISSGRASCGHDLVSDTTGKCLLNGGGQGLTSPVRVSDTVTKS